MHCMATRTSIVYLQLCKHNFEELIHVCSVMKKCMIQVLDVWNREAWCMAHLMSLFVYTNWYTTETNSTYDMTWENNNYHNLKIYIVFPPFAWLGYYAYTLLLEYSFQLYIQSCFIAIDSLILFRWWVFIKIFFFCIYYHHCYISLLCID